MLRRATGIGPVSGRLMLGIGGVAAFGTLRVTRMGGNPGVAVEDLDRPVRDAHLHALAHQAVRDGIAVLVHMDVVIRPTVCRAHQLALS